MAQYNVDIIIKPVNFFVFSKLRVAQMLIFNKLTPIYKYKIFYEAYKCSIYLAVGYVNMP